MRMSKALYDMDEQKRKVAAERQPMNTKQEHTPLPWELHEATETFEIHPANDENGELVLCEFPRDEWVDKTPRFTDAKRLEHARFVLRACNSHDALLAACEALLSIAKAHKCRSHGPAKCDTCWEIAKASAAIGKAKEGGE